MADDSAAFYLVPSAGQVSGAKYINLRCAVLQHNAQPSISR